MDCEPPADVLETEESRDLGQLPNNKRKRNTQIEAAKTALDGGSSDAGAEGTTQQRTVPGAVGEGTSSASPAAPVSTSQRLRFPPYPKSSNSKDVRKWCKECKECRSICEVLAKGYLLNFLLEGALLDPIPKISVGLPNKTVLDGQFLFFNDHYGIALLEIDADFQTQRPSF
ncbi:hypothetical protein HU200_036260 [Digitaria exilis]|uniref:Uncharacterized protein n=1 Tax=Digitaria exilis TaxID=1010633 RepID=A0A835BD54_9POAL|nr:hypothetical protein HU200_036260 [Digitaria exilis]